MPSVRAEIGYSERTERRPFFYANAHEKDFVPLKPVEVDINDARGMDTSLDREGFMLVQHKTALADLTNLDEVAATHTLEIAELLQELSGCDHVAMVPRGILRFSERLGKNAEHDNSNPAWFVHVDMSKQAGIDARARTAPEGRAIARSAQYNVWRAISGPPQDVPLALCAWPSIDMGDLIECDAIFDPPGQPEFTFGNYLLEYSPDHRWYYYSDLTPDEAVVFKTSDSDPDVSQLMPHGAFNNPLAPPDAPARVSIEMRAACYWFE